MSVTAQAGGSRGRSRSGARRAADVRLDCAALRLLNHILSASVDRLWWWQTARKFKAILADPTRRCWIFAAHGHMTMALLKGRPRGTADSGGGLFTGMLSARPRG